MTHSTDTHRERDLIVLRVNQDVHHALRLLADEDRWGDAQRTLERAASRLREDEGFLGIGRET